MLQYESYEYLEHDSRLQIVMTFLFLDEVEACKGVVFRGATHILCAPSVKPTLIAPGYLGH